MNKVKGGEKEKGGDGNPKSRTIPRAAESNSNVGTEGGQRTTGNGRRRRRRFTCGKSAKWADDVSGKDQVM